MACASAAAALPRCRRRPQPAPLLPPPCAANLQPAQAHRYLQDNTQKYGAGGLWAFRLAYLRVVVLSSPETVQAVVSRGNDLPKAPALYDGIDKVNAMSALIVVR